MTAANLPSLEDVVAAGRLADVLAAAELQGRAIPVTRRDRGLPDRLRLVYLVARVGLGEGQRVLLAQARHLAALGADVTVLARAHPDDPDPVEGERRLGPRARLRRVPYGEALADAVPPCDLVVAGSWEFVLPARMLGLAPVVLFERGELQILGDLPRHIEDVLAASLGAASSTYAIGGGVRRALVEGYGVEAEPAPEVVDATVFHPGPRRRPGVRRVVVVGGTDLAGADRSRDIAYVADELAGCHPELEVRRLGTRRGGGLEVPDEDELAGWLRDACCYVSVAERLAVDLGPLEAMASGVPVVTYAHDGVPYAEPGQNALVVEPGDVEGVVEAARSVLEDEDLARRLAASGLETAAARSWSVAAPGLLASYKQVVGASPPAEPLGGFAVSLGGLRFARAGQAARLRARLGACTTQEVAIPVSQPVVGELRAVRWRVVARRDAGVEGVTRVYLPASSDRPLEDAPEQAGIDALRSGRAAEALEIFGGCCQDALAGEQAVLGRWVVLALLEAGRPAEALQMAAAFARDFPTHPDYIVLAVRAGQAARRPVEISGPIERVRLLGSGARYDEWFDDPFALLAADLGAAS